LSLSHSLAAIVRSHAALNPFQPPEHLTPSIMFKIKIYFGIGLYQLLLEAAINQARTE
jgi:hypothetical protein